MTDTSKDAIASPMTDNLIGGVRYDAPLFNRVPLETLLNMVKLLSSASYHFADDSGQETSSGYASVREFAAAANKHRLGFSAVQCLCRDKQQLVTVDQVIDAMLRDARDGHPIIDRGDGK